MQQIHTYITYTHTPMHTYAYINIHTYIHIYIHTHLYILFHVLYRRLAVHEAFTSDDEISGLQSYKNIAEIKRQAKYVNKWSDSDRPDTKTSTVSRVAATLYLTIVFLFLYFVLLCLVFFVFCGLVLGEFSLVFSLYL
jgi:hypothetical protein